MVSLSSPIYSVSMPRARITASDRPWRRDSGYPTAPTCPSWPGAPALQCWSRLRLILRLPVVASCYFMHLYIRGSNLLQCGSVAVYIYMSTAQTGAEVASRARRFFMGGSGRGEVRPGNYSQVFVVRWNFRNSLNRLCHMIINCHMTSASVVS